MAFKKTSPFSLYVHWPFCLSKCPYCDFNSHVRESIDEKSWLDALKKEITRISLLLQSQEGPDCNLVLGTIFFGGGTPSLMRPETVGAIIQHAKDSFVCDENIEITLEANPNSVEVAAFQSLRAAGVNRISIGIQALNDDDLRALGRKHSAADGLRAIDVAQKTFDRVSFDLIYARPGQKTEDWERELLRALSFDTEHLSLYQLMIEPGTAFAAQHARGELILPKHSPEMFELTQNITSQHNMPAYEISNHARDLTHKFGAASSAQCKHNLAYWRYQDYAGVGPGAHGRLTLSGEKKIATRQVKAPELWLQSVLENGHGDAEVIQVTRQEQLQEQLLMGLRLTEGVRISDLVIDLGQALQENVLNKTKLDYLIEGGFLELNPERIKATSRGRQVLQSVLSYFIN